MLSHLGMGRNWVRRALGGVGGGVWEGGQEGKGMECGREGGSGGQGVECGEGGRVSRAGGGVREGTQWGREGRRELRGDGAWERDLYFAAKLFIWRLGHLYPGYSTTLSISFHTQQTDQWPSVRR